MATNIQIGRNLSVVDKRPVTEAGTLTEVCPIARRARLEREQLELLHREREHQFDPPAQQDERRLEGRPLLLVGSYGFGGVRHPPVRCRGGGRGRRGKPRAHCRRR